MAHEADTLWARYLAQETYEMMGLSTDDDKSIMRKEISKSWINTDGGIKRLETQFNLRKMFELTENDLIFISKTYVTA